MYDEIWANISFQQKTQDKSRRSKIVDFKQYSVPKT